MTGSPSWKGLSKERDSGERSRQQPDTPSKLQRYVSLQEIKTAAENQIRLQPALETTAWQQTHQGSTENLEEPGHLLLAGSSKAAPSSPHSPEFELENLQSHDFAESVDMPDFSDIEKKISQKMLIYENRPCHKCDQAQ